MDPVEGKWTGFYEYGLGYELSYFGQRAKLSMELTFENGNIQGISKEEKSANYVNADEDFISFVKHIPFISSLMKTAMYNQKRVN